MLEAGMSQAEVSKRLHCRRSTISLLCQMVRTTGETHDNPRSGRPRISSRRMDLQLCLRQLRKRYLTATQTARESGISRQTVSRRLRECGLRCRRPHRGTILTHHRRERLLICVDLFLGTLLRFFWTSVYMKPDFRNVGCECMATSAYHFTVKGSTPFLGHHTRVSCH